MSVVLTQPVTEAEVPCAQTEIKRAVNARSVLHVVNALLLALLQREKLPVSVASSLSLAYCSRHADMSLSTGSLATSKKAYVPGVLGMSNSRQKRRPLAS